MFFWDQNGIKMVIYFHSHPDREHLRKERRFLLHRDQFQDLIKDYSFRSGTV
uniref:Uncharacterized protein n=1 Tax=Anguilla anguilla TaxID=7936 RepID=A0A0E9WNF1_ANGAN